MAADPQILKNITLTMQIGAGDVEDFSQDVLSAAVVPTPGAVQTAKTLDGVTHQDTEAESWALELTCVIDWSADRPGLAHYLFSNKGSTAAVIFKDTDAAISTTKPAITGNVILVPIPYGGEGNVFATATVVLPFDGTPTLDTTP